MPYKRSEHSVRSLPKDLHEKYSQAICKKDFILTRTIRTEQNPFLISTYFLLKTLIFLLETLMSEAPYSICIVRI